ncbi:hypothetical protein QEN19_000512 [Hanseniaspora menglaensis]
MAATNGNTSIINNTHYASYLNKKVIITFKNITEYQLEGELISFDNYNNITILEDKDGDGVYTIIRGCNIDTIENLK